MRISTTITTVRKTIGIFLTFIFIAVGAKAGNTASDQFMPDFAFPEKVEKESHELMSEAISRQDFTEAFRQMMNLCISNELKESDSYARNMNLIDSVMNFYPQTYRSLAYLLEATITSGFYDRGRYLFDGRHFSADGEWPEDPREWSGDMFKDKILKLIVKSEDSLNSEPEIQLSKFEPLFNFNDDFEKNIFNLSDFILLSSANILKKYSNENSSMTIPFFPDGREFKESISEEMNGEREYLLKKLIDNSEKNGNTYMEALAVCELSNSMNMEAARRYLSDNAKRLRGEYGEGLILYYLWNNNYLSSMQERQILYKEIKEWLGKFKTGPTVKMLEYAEAIMSEKKVSLNLKKYVLPFKSINGEAELTNIETTYLLVYKLSEKQADNYDGLIRSRFSSATKPLHKIALSGGNKPNEIPYDCDVTFEIPGLAPGLYLVVASETPELSKKWNKDSGISYATFRVSSISMVSSYANNEKESGRLYIVGASNQNPVKGALVKYYPTGGKNVAGSLVTETDGSVSMPPGYYRIEAYYGKSMIRGEFGYNYYQEGPSTSNHIELYTDLSVYHPGDTVQFGIIGWKRDGLDKSLMKEREVTVAFRDANYSVVESMTLKLDDNGRANGKFGIPHGKLLGQWWLTASLDEKRNDNIGLTGIEVSDYKLPGFYVTMEKGDTTGSIGSRDMIRFIGKAETYSGMPISNSEVSIEIRQLPSYWRITGFSEASCHLKDTTDINGCFFVELPTANLKGTSFEYGRYSITASVVSPAGETQFSSPLIFSLGESRRIALNLPTKINLDSAELNLDIPVYDLSGLPVTAELDYRLISAFTDKNVAEGSFVSPRLSLASGEIPSGKYYLEVRFPGEEKWERNEIVIFRGNDVKVPYPTQLWVPQKEYIYHEGEDNIAIKFGSYWPDSKILCIISDGDKILKQEWLDCDSCMSAVNVNLPSSSGFLFVNLGGMHDFDRKTEQISIIPAKSLEKLKVSVKTFRENLSAGNSEKWSFEFKINDAPVRDISAMAVMTDKALNSIRDFNWIWNLPDYKPYSHVHSGGLYPGISTLVSKFSSRKVIYPSIGYLPEWATYGYSLYGVSGRKSSRLLYSKSDMSRGMIADATGVVESSMKMANAMTTMEADDADETVESQEINGDNGSEKNEEPELRPVDMPLAFFYPNLDGDQEGNVTLEFKVPDFNTTWQFQILGYTSDLLGATLKLDAVSSKAVMVKSNLPTYLLTGDKVEITAMLFNNSPEINSIGGRLIIENPLNGDILAERKFDPTEVEPYGNRTVSMDFKVPEDIEILRVKSYALSGENSDGEQGYILIYPSSTPVTESTTFYLSSEKETTTVRLPDFRKSSNVYLKYCDNPIWECLMSLTPLIDASSANSLSLAASIYSNSVGYSILEKNDALREGLEKLLSSSDSTITLSNLMRDSELKTVGLQMTPWLNNASSDVERIRNLSSLTDRDRVMEFLTRDIGRLKKLQNSDGGWSWLEGFRSSSFITLEILKMLGYAEKEIIQEGEISAMVRRGISYYDSYLTEMREKRDRLPVLSTLDYLYVRGLFRTEMKSGMRKIETECLNDIKENWRKWDITAKSKAALVLWRKGIYKDEVEKILSSIEEFAKKDENKGWYFASDRINSVNGSPLQAVAMSLSAFKTISPTSQAVEGFSQWLLLQKETEDWGDDITKVGVIRSLIDTYAHFNTARALPRIFLGDKKIKLTEKEACAGSFMVSLDSQSINGKALVLKRERGVPAWGGVISQYISPIKEVKNASTGELSVAKKIYKVVDGKEKELKSGETLHSGDKISVVLTIDCKKEMDYIAVIDHRGAFMQPTDQLSGMTYTDGIAAYREIRADKTSFYIERMPVGKYKISYDCTIGRAGTYSVGIVQVQSLYSPAQSAHSAGMTVEIGSGL